MARRIEIELTSTRDDGTWTWRANGAREPRGVVDAATLPGSPSVGDVLRVEVDTGLDGTEIVAVLPPKETRKEPELLPLLGRDLRDDELVTSKLVGKRGRRDRDGDDDRRGGRGRRDGKPGDRGRGRGDRRGGERGERSDRGPRQPRDGGRGPGDRSDRGDRGDRGPRSDRPRRRPVDDKPRPKRLRAQRNHRRAVLDTLEAHERPIADEVLRGGLPAVRQAVEKQNAQARAEGRPEVDATALEALAERLLPRLRAAEWRDRADAALADIDELDLRDLRTVVVAADSAAKDDEAKALAAQLKEGLERRIEADHAAWLTEIGSLLDDGRVVRALRVSSRPPKAGVPLPPDLATRLVDGASASLTADTFDDRWATVLDALSLSPVHARVAPQSIPAEPSEALRTTVAGFGTRVPLVAAALGVEPTAPPKRPRRGGRPQGGSRPGAKGATQRGRPVPPPPAKQASPAPTVEEATSVPEPEPKAAAPIEIEAARPTDTPAAPSDAEATTPVEAPDAAPAHAAPAESPVAAEPAAPAEAAEPASDVAAETEGQATPEPDAADHADTGAEGSTEPS